MDKRFRDNILSTLRLKTILKKQITETVNANFDNLKTLIRSIVQEYNQVLAQDESLGLQLSTKLIGDHVAELEIGGDTLLFVRHNNIFQLDRDNGAWQLDYVKESPERTYTGIISVYNFLTDSFSYDRDEDLGYMIARIFINADGCFFVEGKRQRGMGVEHFGKKQIDEKSLRKFVETAVKYTVEFDLLTPPYDAVKITDLMHMKLEMQSSRSKTGKRLGFQFNSDDVK